jgi:hypothetical protein
MDPSTRVDSGLAPLIGSRSLTFPKGSVIALVGPPESPTDSILAQAAAAHPTTYYTTKRAPTWTAETIAASTDYPLDVRVEGVCHAPRVAPVRLRREYGERPQYEELDTVPPEASEVEDDRFEKLSARLLARDGHDTNTLVVDDFTDYTDGTRRCLSLLDTIRSVTESLTWLHVVHPTNDHPHAEAVITAADAVCWVERNHDDEAQLAVPRRRGAAPITDPVSLSF